MAWIEAHQSLAESPKLMKLCKRLKIPHSQGIGHLFFLWWWALDHAPDGDLSALGATGVARVVRWEGEHLRSVLPALKRRGSSMRTTGSTTGRITPGGSSPNEKKSASRIGNGGENNAY